MTLKGAHRQAERLASRARLAIHAGQRSQALDLFRRAAAKEQQAYEKVPTNLIRTREAVAISVVSLWYKGRCWKTAEKLIYRFLSQESFEDGAQCALKELLEVVLDEQALEAESHAACSPIQYEKANE